MHEQHRQLSKPLILVCFDVIKISSHNIRTSIMPSRHGLYLYGCMHGVLNAVRIREYVWACPRLINNPRTSAARPVATAGENGAAQLLLATVITCLRVGWRPSGLSPLPRHSLHHSEVRVLRRGSIQGVHHQTDGGTGSREGGRDGGDWERGGRRPGRG